MILPRVFSRSGRDYRCLQFVEVVTEYLEGSMRTRDRARFEAHLRACHGCEHYLAQLRRTIELTGRLGVADVAALGPSARRQLLDAFRDFHTPAT
jgi:anti-sigma factor RsiW